MPAMCYRHAVSVPVYKPHCLMGMLQAGHLQPSSPVARPHAAIATRGHAALQSKVHGHIHVSSVYRFSVNATTNYCFSLKLLHPGTCMQQLILQCSQVLLFATKQNIQFAMQLSVNRAAAQSHPAKWAVHANEIVG